MYEYVLLLTQIPAKQRKISGKMFGWKNYCGPLDNEAKRAVHCSFYIRKHNIFPSNTHYLLLLISVYVCMSLVL